MKLSDLKVGQVLSGVLSSQLATVVAVTPLGESVTLVYRGADGVIGERLLTRSEEERISEATAGVPWKFDGDGDAFKLAIEAKRIDLAFLFDPMMAVHASNVQPLPHQITAVYESMLPRQPLRFVLADDPGAGKTIMAGLYIRELLMRADSRRVLIVAPGSLVVQWSEELWQKFGLRFQVFSQQFADATPGLNPFTDHDQLIVRLDQISRSEELSARIAAAKWDLVIFDEAHKLAAHYVSDEIKYTKRYRLAEELGAATRHLLLMTATPHNGIEQDYQLFLKLLDTDRFYGRFNEERHTKVDASDLMRRMVKEELVKFDNTPLFPERRANTINYTLSPLEAELYEMVTSYVRTEMGRADNLDGKRKGAVGFALTLLQRRLASSPEAIYQSLRRRRDRLQTRLDDIRKGKNLSETVFGDVPDDDDDLSAEEQETLEESMLDEASAARTTEELMKEIVSLSVLEAEAQKVVTSRQDRKWDELSKILQHDAETRGPDGKLRKLIVFTEHRDTLNYLQRRIGDVLGSQDPIVTIHGGTPRERRLEVQGLFRNDKDIRVLLATDAAGEGVNLQVANLMVNYDLPWNPNRLEQRFGRIHRIGQTEVCHLWNLVAKDTREGEVYGRLLSKLEVESKALKGRVFDILGAVFEGTPLRDLLLEAIRYGEKPEVKAKLKQQVESAFDRDHLLGILDRNALAQETMTAERLFRVKEEMEKAEARKLQPHFVQSWFLKAFEAQGGKVREAERNRWEITRVPQLVRDRDRVIKGRNVRDPSPVLERYARVTFMPDLVKPLDKPNWAEAELLHPGHPLVLAVSDLTLDKHADLLRQGAVLVDPNDEFGEHVLFLLTHELRDSREHVVSKRLQFVRVFPDGSSSFAGWGPHLDLSPLDANDRPLLEKTLSAPWLTLNLEQRALELAASKLAPEHFEEAGQRRIEHLKKTREEVHRRLTREIDYWTDQYQKLKDDRDAGKNVNAGNIEKARLRANELSGRLESRNAELRAMEQLASQPPVVLGGALVVPSGLVRELRGEKAELLSQDPLARARIERLAMEAVRKAEEARGCRVEDVSAQKCGWDLTSWPPA
ncbi:MAG: helicase-related protein, partial [Archangium sp.]